MAVVTAAVTSQAISAGAIVNGQVLPGGYYNDQVPSPNPYAFVGRLPNSGGGSCMASLVAPSLALTAGHCDAAKGDEIVFGVLNWDRHVKNGEGIVRTIAATAYEGDAWTRGSSTELLSLTQPVLNIQPVRLASPGDSSLWAKNKSLQSVGFGDIIADCPTKPQILSAELRSADMKITDTAVSVGIYHGLAKAQSVEGYPQHGDSGEPLIATDATGKFVQVGIYQADVGACGHNYAFYYDRIWPQKNLLQYVASHQSATG